MIDEMGIFRTTVGVASLAASGAQASVANVMVDTGSEYSWLPEELLARLEVAPVRIDRFETANGRILERRVGFAMLYAAGRSAPSIIVFAEPGDLRIARRTRTRRSQPACGSCPQGACSRRAGSGCECRVAELPWRESDPYVACDPQGRLFRRCAPQDDTLFRLRENHPGL